MPALKSMEGQDTETTLEREGPQARHVGVGRRVTERKQGLPVGVVIGSVERNARGKSLGKLLGKLPGIHRDWADLV